MKKILMMGALLVAAVGLTSCTCSRDSALYQTIPVGVTAADAQGAITNANGPALEMLGYTLDELKAKTWQEITPEKWHAMEDEMVKLAQDEPYAIYQKTYTRKDGSVLPVQIIVWTVKGSDGAMTGTGAIFWPLGEIGIAMPVPATAPAPQPEEQPAPAAPSGPLSSD